MPDMEIFTAKPGTCICDCMYSFVVSYLTLKLTRKCPKLIWNSWPPSVIMILSE